MDALDNNTKQRRFLIIAILVVVGILITLLFLRRGGGEGGGQYRTEAVSRGYVSATVSATVRQGRLRGWIPSTRCGTSN